VAFSFHDPSPKGEDERGKKGKKSIDKRNRLLEGPSNGLILRWWHCTQDLWVD
jgi:hypothetical protein